MHKIKEMLHMDDSDKKTTTAHATHSTNTTNTTTHHDADLKNAHHDEHKVHHDEKKVVHEQHHDTTKVHHADLHATEKIKEGKVVKEHIKEVEVHQVQPVIHREREQREIHHVVQPEREVLVSPTEKVHVEKSINLGERHVESTLKSDHARGIAPRVESSKQVEVERQHQDMPTKVEEHVHKVVEEHIHPVVYREVLKPKVTQETQHMYETVKEKPIETYEVRDIKGSNASSLGLAEREFLEKTIRADTPIGTGVTPATQLRTSTTTTTASTTTAPVVASQSVAYDAALQAPAHGHSKADLQKISEKNHEKHAKEHKNTHQVV